jgi:hypothetical protein
MVGLPGLAVGKPGLIMLASACEGRPPMFIRFIFFISLLPSIRPPAAFFDVDFAGPAEL